MSESNGAKGGVVSDVRIYKTLPVFESLNPLKRQKGIGVIYRHAIDVADVDSDRQNPSGD
jgi:hypothetical protein